jgi:hypothetical protein
VIHVTDTVSTDSFNFARSGTPISVCNVPVIAFFGWTDNSIAAGSALAGFIAGTAWILAIPNPIVALLRCTNDAIAAVIFMAETAAITRYIIPIVARLTATDYAITTSIRLTKRCTSIAV